WRETRRAQDAADEGEALAHLAVALALLLVGAALALVAVCEWAYLRDVFNNRMNTVFKLYYQAWTLFSVAAAFGVSYVYDHRMLPRPSRVAVGAALGLALLGCLAVTPAALANRTGGFTESPTLDGLAFLQRSSPAEAAAADWLVRQASIPAILEA